jgi:hypothetical protein
MSPLRVTFNSCVATVATLALVPTARANIGPRWWGDVVTEPWGLKEVAIVHERLAIDLRPLAKTQPVRVEVSYELRNAGESKTFDLLFVSGAVGISDFEARIDDKPLQTQQLSRDELRLHWDRFPKDWQPPSPGLGFERSGHHYPHFHDWAYKAVPVAFSVELPHGSSTLRVSYRARACGTDEEHQTVTWQFPYVLAPAREWGDFGRLDVTVNLPEGWEARSSPDLDRHGSTLHGSFTGLPADTLLLATRAPVPPEYYLTPWLSLAIYLITWVGGVIVCRRAGWRQGLSRVPDGTSPASTLLVRGLRALLLLVVPPVLWAFLVFFTGGFLPRIIMTAGLRVQESPYFHEDFFGLVCGNLVLCTPAALLFGFIITLASASRAAYEKSVNMPPPT